MAENISWKEATKIVSTNIFGSKKPSKRKISEEESIRTPEKKQDNKTTPVKMSNEANGGHDGANLPIDSLSIAPDFTDEDLENIGLAAAGVARANDDGTFAGKAKKPKKETFPWALYVYAGKISRDRITKRHFAAFQVYCETKVMNMTVDDSAKINVKYWHWYGDFGIIVCMDRGTAHWIKAQCHAFTFEGKDIRAYARWERAAAYIYRCFLSGPGWKEMKGHVAINAALKQSGIANGTYHNLIWDTKKAPNGVHFSFECRGELEAKLEQVGLSLKFGTQWKSLDKRLRQGRSEREWLKFFGYLKEPSAASASTENDNMA